jgi:glycosyltransferase involved in cell wall biosynthesis
VLASRIAADGDRDGLPNVLMEAQSQGLACVATRVSAIPELIEEGVTGLLVAPQSAAAGRRIVPGHHRAGPRAAALAAAGSDIGNLAGTFGMEANIVRLARRFGLQLPAGRVSASPIVSSRPARQNIRCSRPHSR